ncbi:hypothetical protein FHX10_006749 [Rhizobium sp. BK591]|nr:hypothetical protein [Rhizobium sp. BK591]
MQELDHPCLVIGSVVNGYIYLNLRKCETLPWISTEYNP